ncbi:MAG TPA: DUF2807 domain-containing protein [Bacteroidaceae bacterium]|nr:DUF2807 domain-containing protein [Bacteroidaceae bacterium]
MKQGIFISGILLVSVMTGCNKDPLMITGSGTIISKVVPADDFSSIELTNSASVELIKGTDPEVKVQDYENILQYLEVKVVRDNLVIKTSPNIILFNSRATVYATTPDDISGLTLTGSGNIRIKSSFDNISEVIIPGSGNITAEQPGQSNDLMVQIIGSGSLNFGLIQCNTVTCTISGSGDATVWADNTLNVTITGSGNLYYYGNPTVNKTTTGSGNVIKL